MSKLFDLDLVQEALNEAAHNARYGSPGVQAGRFDDDDTELKKTTAQELLRILRESGFERRDARGAHEIWHNSVTQKSIVVPTTGTSRRTANSLLLQAGLSKAF